MREVTAADLQERIPFDRDALDEGIEEQAGLFLQAAELFAHAVSRRDEAKTAMEQEFARACSRARGGEEKKTEAAVKEAAQLDKRYMQAETAFLVAKREADLAQTVREAFDMRGKMLREMAQLYIAGYYQASSVSGRTRRDVDTAAASRARQLMNTSRQAKRGERGT